jgi:hypothetical protein
MSIFGKIAAAIFGVSAAHAEEKPTDMTPTPSAGAAPATGGAQPTAAAASAAPNAGGPAAAAPKVAMAGVDVAARMDAIADQQDEDLDWRKSIVDLMKLLKLDSSLKARKELATELKYSGDMSDSASMNVWLHKQVMTKLAENGGVVPAELKH